MANYLSGAGRLMPLSNVATDVFFSVFQFALSDLAVSPWEHQLAQWVAWRDQDVRGRGAVGFDLEDISWTPDDFAAQKAFVLRAVDLSMTGYRWDELCYETPFAQSYLRDFRAIVEAFPLPSELPEPAPFDAWPDLEDHEELCPRHRIHTAYGHCRVCEDCPEQSVDDDRSEGAAPDR